MDFVKEYFWLLFFGVGIIGVAFSFVKTNKQIDRALDIPPRRKDTPWKSLDSNEKKMRIAWYIQISIVLIGLVSFGIIPGLLGTAIGFLCIIICVPLHFVLKNLERFFAMMRYVDATGDTTVLDDLVDGFGNPYNSSPT